MDSLYLEEGLMVNNKNIWEFKKRTHFGVKTVPHPSGQGTPRLLLPRAVCTSATWAAGSSTYCEDGECYANHNNNNSNQKHTHTSRHLVQQINTLPSS